VLAIMGEYDALPGISQKASAVRAPHEEGAAGHGCAHNLFGTASLAPKDVPWHAWPVVASSRTSIGHKGMIRAAHVLAATAVDLFADTATRAGIQKEWAEKTKDVTYKWLVPDGPPLLPNRR
jgi:hypothetical protein